MRWILNLTLINWENVSKIRVSESVLSCKYDNQIFSDGIKKRLYFCIFKLTHELKILFIMHLVLKDVIYLKHINRLMFTIFPN